MPELLTPTEPDLDHSARQALLGANPLLMPRAYPHYDRGLGTPEDTVFFYGGPYSNFVGGPWFIEAPQPWQDEPYLARYGTTEHFFAASKAKTKQEHERIRLAQNAAIAKSRGRAVSLRPDWEERKYAYMLIALRVKFQDPWFQKQLLWSSPCYIAEDSPTDFIWGIRDEDGGWTGLNLLGRALMKVRDELITSDPA